jgi:prophage DNA circulation protein
MAAIGLATSLLSASYKGVPFLAIRSTITGGRKTVIKKFPNSDKQLVEDLGLDVKSFRMDAVTTTDASDDQLTYFNNRDTLLSKLDDGEKGTLIHPFDGIIDNVVVTSYVLIEDMTRIGEARYTINFAISDTTGEPIKSEFVLSEISSKVDAANAQIEANLANEYKLDTNSTSNYKSAISKVEDAIDEFNENTSFLQASADEIDSFSNELGDLSASITSIVTSPTNLADSIGSLFSTVNGLYATVNATYVVLTKFFGFGDEDSVISTLTAQREEDNTNRKTLNGAMQCFATTYSYLNASQIEFTTVDE